MKCSSLILNHEKQTEAFHTELFYWNGYLCLIFLFAELQMFHNNLYEMKGIKYSSQDNRNNSKKAFLFHLNCETFLLYFQLLTIYH